MAISDLNFFNHHHHWLIYDDSNEMKVFQNIFQHLNLSVDTDISYVIRKTNSTPLKSTSTSYVVYDVYNNGFQIGGSLNITADHEVECSSTACLKHKHLSNLHMRSVYGNRESLSDIIMRVAVVVTRFNLNASHSEINAFLSSQKDFYIDPLARFGFQMLLLLKDSLYTNFSFQYFDKWTDAQTTGGIVGALVNQTVDLTSSPFIMIPIRFKFLTPIAPTGDFRSVCMFRTPRNSGIKSDVFVEPFSTKVWIYFGIILVLASLFLWFTFVVEYYKMRNYLTFIPSFLTTCLISIGSACAQSSYLVPGSIGGRFVFITLMLISFIMLNYYTSVVVSLLLGSPVKSNIKTMSDLADSNLDVGLEPLPFTYSYLNSSTLPEVKRFVKQKVIPKIHTNNLWYSAQEGIMRMRNRPGFVFVFEVSTGYNLIERTYEAFEICDLNEVLFRPDTQLVTHLHRNSTYKEIVRLKIIRIMETGVHAKHRRQWVRTHLNCLTNNFIVHVGLEYTASLFIMLLNQVQMAAIFNCWNIKTQLQLQRMTSMYGIFMQNINTNYAIADHDFEKSYFQHQRPFMGVFMDFNCWQSEALLNKVANDLKLFDHHYRWLIYDEISNITKFKNFFANFNLYVDTDLTYAMLNEEYINSSINSTFLLYDVYNQGQQWGGRLNVTADRAISCSHRDCHLQKYLSTLRQRSKSGNRERLSDITLRVCTVETWSVTETVGGCIGALGYDHSADLLSTPFLFTEKRALYTRPILRNGHFRSICIFRTPRKANLNAGVFMEPFSLTVWILFAIVLGVIGGFLWFIFLVEHKRMKIFLTYTPSLLTTCLMSFGTACVQGSPLIPNSLGGRLTFICLSLLTFIMYNYYTSIVVSTLLGAPIKSDIKSMGQLADSNLEVAMEPLPYNAAYLNFSKLPEIKRFVKRKIDSKENPASVWIPAEEGILRVRDEPGFVYIFEAFSFGLVERYYDAHEICDLNEVLFRPPADLHTHVNRNSSFTEILRWRLLRIFETGIYGKFHRHWINTRLNCYLGQNVLIQVGLEYTAPLFVMLICSYILVLIFILLEILWKHFEGRKP
uniref:Ionotropic receptor 75a N-terminal domain-containing protein n=1 Tax=Glossina brevipalpis TaxID=37001 RepID=A0A1A9WE51_9MUSC